MQEAEREGNLLFPVFLKLEELNLLVVGGGFIGMEKMSAVLKNSPATHVTLVGIIISEEIKEFVKEYPNVTLVERAFLETDLDGKDIVIAATSDRALNAYVKQEAKKRKVLANIADTPDLCDFYLGSIVKKGDLKIAISTNGKSPTLAKRMRQFFEEHLPDSTQLLLDNLTNIRNQLGGAFEEKVNRLNEITSSFLSQQEKAPSPPTIKESENLTPDTK
ncbi:bifunctional precorrin-2 dehydrogenase/sirohydrochlorin ferrochelatase [Rhodocytophaga aerolata]|uniref:precorrin-2 dehydrogenase n=1 Tax=Rhodocytophaga aerolata TaxID=455078 RepID=A0ABT8RAF9_9BACT|nr:bifunctional precorrin-2 dehydrogenase/sirohydrochlorin ferrochelatase [Rhodocytophaga aerolata]MDO1448314.1 bifunctional precorrin-2 dehydrogenase/sirohydrochlorin ferrochelatase [Rhodocytophaga aerolata]